MDSATQGFGWRPGGRNAGLRCDANDNHARPPARPKTAKFEDLEAGSWKKMMMKSEHSTAKWKGIAELTDGFISLARDDEKVSFGRRQQGCFALLL